MPLKAIIDVDKAGRAIDEPHHNTQYRLSVGSLPGAGPSHLSLEFHCSWVLQQDPNNASAVPPISGRIRSLRPVLVGASAREHVYYLE